MGVFFYSVRSRKPGLTLVPGVSLNIISTWPPLCVIILNIISVNVKKSNKKNVNPICASARSHAAKNLCAQHFYLKCIIPRSKKIGGWGIFLVKKLVLYLASFRRFWNFGLGCDNKDQEQNQLYSPLDWKYATLTFFLHRLGISSTYLFLLMIN